MNRRTRAALAAAVLLALAALGAARSASAATTPSSMADIYSSLRLEHLAPLFGSTQFTSGDQVYFTYDFLNASASPLVVPPNSDYGRIFHLVGVEQTWVERLGPDPTIPSMWWAARDGNRYAAGGSIIAEDGAFPDDTIPAGAALSRSFVLFTSGFPLGRYRYTV
jgi:hypothetical protein